MNRQYNKRQSLTVTDKQGFRLLLEKDHSVTVHHKNLQVLATEMFKFSPWHYQGYIWVKRTPIQPTVRIKLLYMSKC